MDLLESVKKMSGAESALGLRFSHGKLYAPVLPDGSQLIGYTDSVYYCFVDGYQDTVFAVVSKSGYGNLVFPVAYDFREFLRLVIACGSAATVAMTGFCQREQFSSLIVDLPKKKFLEILQKRFDLQPIEDPYDYVQTVRQVIDCRQIRC